MARTESEGRETTDGTTVPGQDAPASRLAVRGVLVQASETSTGVLHPVHELGAVTRDRDVLLVVDGISAVGAAFLGYHTPEAAGDYAAGPSHVLPTGGAVRFASPLGVYDFVVRTSLIRYSREALAAQADLLESLATLEGLEAHARAVRFRR